MKKYLSIICAAAMMLSACDKKEDNAVSTKPIVKIGATLPLSGDAAEAGIVTREAMEMTLDNLRRKGLKYNYEVIYEDNQLNPQKVATTTNKLINMDKVDAVFSFWGLMGNVAADISDKNGVMSFSSTFGDYSNRGKYSYNLSSTYEAEAKLMTEELKKRGVKSVAFFVDSSEISDQYVALEKELKENSDIKIVFNEKFNSGEKDYKMAIIKAQSFNPDLYFISGYAPSPYLFLKQLKEITSRNDNVTSFDTLSEIDTKDRGIAEGLWYLDSNLGGTEEFISELQEKKGVNPQSCTGSMSAGLEIFINAVENTGVSNDGKIDKDRVNTWIMNNIKNYPSYVGLLNVMDNHKIKVNAVIKEIKDGKTQRVKD